MRKLFTLTLALLASFSLWAVDTATWTFESNATGLTIVDAGSASTARAKYSDTGSSWTDASGTYGMYANLGSTKGSSTTITTDKEYLNISQISLKLGTSDRGKTEFALQVSPKADFSSDVTDVQARVTISGNISEITKNTAMFTKTYNIDTPISGYIRITLAQASGSNNKKMIVDDLTITYVDCQAADATFSATSTALVITNEVPAPSTTLNFTKGDNTSNPIYSVTKGGETTTDASVEGTTFTATAAGTYTITATQEADGTYCEVIKEVTITVTAEIPVTACSIEGPTAGIIGQELTYTATAANATAFAWYVDDALQEGETDAEFVYTGVKGNHSIYATATNAYTATPVASNTIALTVTKVCGELIAFTAETGSSNIDKDVTATGVVGGTVHQNTYKNAKLGENGKFISLTLANGSFMKEDVVDIVITPEGNEFKVPGTVKLSSVLDNTDFIGQATGLSATSGEDITATIVLEKGANTIYLSRTSSFGQNPIVKSISVTRSCEESSDASVESLTVNGVAVAKDAELNKFEYTVSTNYAEENVTVAFTIHPLATSDKVGNTFTIPTPSAGDTNGASFKVTAEDGTQVTYTVFITKAASLSDDATLKELSVAGLTIDPAFDAETTAYTVTKAYEAAMPVVGDVTATANDANAKSVNIALAGKVFTITVTAEDNTTTKDYTITVNNAPAIKSLSRVLFSNGFDAFIDNTNRTVKAFYLDGTTAPTATTITAGANCTAGSIEDGKIVVTGADESFVEYAVTLEAVTANTNVVEESAAAGTFDGTEAWVKNGLLVYGNAAGFANNKYVLRRQHKGADPADDQRAIAGWVRTYFFVGNASKLQLTVTDNKKLKYAIDGGNYTASDDASTLEINLEAGNHMIEIVTNQQSGDCTLSAPKLVKRTPTAIDNTADEIKAVKFVENGQLFIRRGEKVYTITGEEVK